MNKDNFSENNTIAAISTPPGEGGIAVIRISGKDSLEVLQAIFVNKNNEKPDNFTSHKLVYGSIQDPVTGTKVDNVMCTYLKAPNSYTGDDTVEIYCHGGYVVPKKILQLILSSGAEPAEAGEFTKRAFLNGKMDLSQAEAVANVIHAQTESGLAYAESQLEGVLSNQINSMKEELLDLLAEVEAHVDFPEEDIEDSVKNDIVRRTRKVIDSIDSLLKSYNTGKIYKNGINTAILGKPNVGKSSLLNLLLKQERAIVSPVAGTTRDFIEEIIDLEGIPLKITDTAGIRAATDEIEKIGVGLTGKKAREAEFLIIMIDSSTEIDDNDIEVLKSIDKKKCVFLLNKCDLERKTHKSDLAEYTRSYPVVEISAKSGSGLENLKNVIRDIIIGGENLRESSEAVLTDLRHKQCLDKCKDHLNRFLKLLENDESPEFLAIDLRVSLDSLGEITGEVTTEDLLGKIFSKFCVGK